MSTQTKSLDNHQPIAPIRHTNNLLLHIDVTFTAQRIGNIVGKNLDEEIVTSHLPVLITVGDALHVPRITQMHNLGIVTGTTQIMSRIELKERGNVLFVARECPDELGS